MSAEVLRHDIRYFIILLLPASSRHDNNAILLLQESHRMGMGMGSKEPRMLTSNRRIDQQRIHLSA